MSLDVWLESDTPVTRTLNSGIFIREEGRSFEISREEWDRRFPGREPVAVLRDDDETNEVYHGNVTHNLGRMADEAGIYDPLWRPDEISITDASQLIAPLEVGLAKLKDEPEHFKQFNPENGWGNYEVLVKFVENYLAACKEHPNASVRVWR